MDAARSWERLDAVLAPAHSSHERIDDALRAWIGFATADDADDDEGRPGDGEERLARGALRLLRCRLFAAQKTYIRRQIVYGLLQEDDAVTLHLFATFFLLDGRGDNEGFEMLSAEGGFARLVELVKERKDDGEGLLRRLLELLYEMSRIQRLGWEDLKTVDDEFVLFLFQIIESLSDDVNDPYHYPVIRVLLVLNEQYMVSEHSPGVGEAPSPLTNRVIKILSLNGSDYKTFGENIILLLNRESETSLQLLILKLLYLLFSTKSTLEYFYTNDLHVLVDILLRNLLDLPSEGAAAGNLRHTYLRVLHPLLTNTQLKHPPHYKRDDIRQVLFMLANVSHAHFAPADETTVRLVGRCIQVPWLQTSDERDAAAAAASDDLQSPTMSITIEDADGNDNGADVPPGGSLRRPGLLGVGMLPEAHRSALSVAALSEKPGVLSPSRRREHENGTVSPPERSPFLADDE